MSRTRDCRRIEGGSDSAEGRRSTFRLSRAFKLIYKGMDVREEVKQCSCSGRKLEDYQKEEKEHASQRNNKCS